MEGELGQSGGSGSTGAAAFEAAAAVAGDAGELAVDVGASGASPDPAGPVVRRGGEGAVGEGVEGEAATLQDVVAGVWLDGWPDGKGTVVDDG